MLRELVLGMREGTRRRGGTKIGRGRRRTELERGTSIGRGIETRTSLGRKRGPSQQLMKRSPNPPSPSLNSQIFSALQ